jgi:hypothetical protein
VELARSENNCARRLSKLRRATRRMVTMIPTLVAPREQSFRTDFPRGFVGWGFGPDARRPDSASGFARGSMNVAKVVRRAQRQTAAAASGGLKCRLVRVKLLDRHCDAWRIEADCASDVNLSRELVVRHARVADDALLVGPDNEVVLH